MLENVLDILILRIGFFSVKTPILKIYLSENGKRVVKP